MARPKSTGPTDHELSILKILWEESPLNVTEILERLDKKPKPAYSSLLTIVRLMDKKGYLKYEKKGKAFFYSPILNEKKYLKKEIKKLVNNVFEGSQYQLAVNLIQEDNLNRDEIENLKKILEEL